MRIATLFVIDRCHHVDEGSDRRIIHQRQIIPLVAGIDAERGMEAFSGTPEEFEAFLKEQLVLWEKLIADAGIEKQ